MTIYMKRSKPLCMEIQKMMAIMLMKCSLGDHFTLALQAGRALVGRDCTEGGLSLRHLTVAGGLALTH